jgi:hypothetical protein
MHLLAMVKHPNVEKMENFAHLIHQSEPEVDDEIGYMDGLALTSECFLEPIEQDPMYSGHHYDIIVNNIFVYGLDCKVFLCAINFLGSWPIESITANILPYNCKIVLRIISNQVETATKKNWLTTFRKKNTLDPPEKGELKLLPQLS